jgi:hypothetical protein
LSRLIGAFFAFLATLFLAFVEPVGHAACPFRVTEIGELPDTRTARIEFFDSSSTTLIVAQGIPYRGVITAMELGKTSQTYRQRTLPSGIVPIDVGFGHLLLSDGEILASDLRSVGHLSGAVGLQSRECAMVVSRGFTRSVALVQGSKCGGKTFQWPSGFVVVPDSGALWAVNYGDGVIATVGPEGPERKWTFSSDTTMWALRNRPGPIQSVSARGRFAAVGGFEKIEILDATTSSTVVLPETGLGVLDIAALGDQSFLFGATDGSGTAFLGYEAPRKGVRYVAPADWKKVDVSEFERGPKGSALVAGPNGSVYEIAPSCY